jgi:glycerol-3-phosphate dehydrogenase
MAEDTVSRAIEWRNLSVLSACVTATTPLVGAHAYHPALAALLATSHSLPLPTATHLVRPERCLRVLGRSVVDQGQARTYGDRAEVVLRQAKDRTPLHPRYPFMVGEVAYLVRNEYARTTGDVLSRRLRLSFLDVAAAMEAAPAVAEVLATVLKWSRATKKQRLQAFLDECAGEMGGKYVRN